MGQKGTELQEQPNKWSDTTHSTLAARGSDPTGVNRKPNQTKPNQPCLHFRGYISLIISIQLSLSLTLTLPSFTLLYTTLSFLFNHSIPYITLIYYTYPFFTTLILIHIPLHTHSHSIPFTFSLSLFTYSFTLSISIPIYFLFNLLSIPFNQLIHFYQNKHYQQHSLLFFHYQLNSIHQIHILHHTTLHYTYYLHNNQYHHITISFHNTLFLLLPYSFSTLEPIHCHSTRLRSYNSQPLLHSLQPTLSPYTLSLLQQNTIPIYIQVYHKFTLLTQASFAASLSIIIPFIQLVASFTICSIHFQPLVSTRSRKAPSWLITISILDRRILVPF